MGGVGVGGEHDVYQLQVLTSEHARMQWKGLYTALLVLPSHNYLAELVKLSADSMNLRRLRCLTQYTMKQDEEEDEPLHEYDPVCTILKASA